MLRRRAGVAEWREASGSVVLVQGQNVLAVNRVGNEVWELLAQPATIESVESRLQARWPGREVGADLRGFVARLDALGLIEDV